MANSYLKSAILFERDGYHFKQNDEISLEKDMFYCIQQKVNSGDEGWLLENRYLIFCCLQNNLVSFLNYFLHGSFLSRRSKILYPLLVEYSSRILNQQVYRLGIILSILNKQDSDFALSIQQLKSLSKKKRKSDLDIAAFIGVIYKEAKDFLQRNLSSKQGSLQYIHIEPLDHALLSKDKVYLRPLVKIVKFINKRMADTLSGFYLHGSLATMDYVKGYSDVDTLMIIEADTISSADKLIKLRDNCLHLNRMFFSIDPIQHHGIFSITSFDLNFFSQGYFPLILLKFAKSLLKGKGTELKIRERDSKVDRSNLYWKMLFTMRHWNEEGARASNMYELKSHCQYLLLFPIIFLQTKGIFFYKRDFFKKFQLDKLENAIGRISLMRSQWETAVYQTKDDFLKRKTVSVIFNIFNLFVATEFVKRFIYKGIPKLAFRSVSPSEIKDFIFYAQACVERLNTIYEDLNYKS